MEFKDKIVLITGAGSGIGKVAALAFAKEGAKVIIADINEKNGQDTWEEAQQLGAEGFFRKVDVSKFEAQEALHQAIIEQYGRLDIALNNAGISGPFVRTTDISLKQWDQVIAVNASSVFYGMKLQIQQMLKQGGGIILNTASVAGLRGLPNSLAYTASKHAVVGMTKTAAMEYAKKNIRINAICPVFTVTALFNPDMLEKVAPGIPDKLRKNIPMKRFADPLEVVNAMLWLCSDKATFVTGQAMAVDGGVTA